MRKYFLLVLTILPLVISCNVDDICRSEYIAGLQGADGCFYSNHLSGREDDPNAYLDAFIADAARYNIDLSYVNNGTKRMELWPIARLRQEYPNVSNSTKAVAIGSCNRFRNNNNIVWVAISQEDWNGWNFGQRLTVVYHELSHDILNMAHSSNPLSLMHPNIANASWSADRVVLSIRDNFHDARSGDRGNLCP